MAVGANTYGTVAGIEKLIGDMVESRTFTTGTVPTLAQVESELDNIAADLNRELDAAGYTVPVNGTNYPTARAYMASINEYGAAATLLATVPSEVYDPTTEVEASGGITRIEMYSNKLKSALKVIQDGRIRAGRRVERMAHLFTGAQEDSEGNEKKPFFTRGMDDYPGVILTESGDNES